MSVHRAAEGQGVTSMQPDINLRVGIGGCQWNVLRNILDPGEGD